MAHLKKLDRWPTKKLLWALSDFSLMLHNWKLDLNHHLFIYLQGDADSTDSDVSITAFNLIAVQESRTTCVNTLNVRPFLFSLHKEQSYVKKTETKLLMIYKNTILKKQQFKYGIKSIGSHSRSAKEIPVCNIQ